ncbi:hypothetical protein G4B84_002823, partial [Aspergillus flavus NRRL3357]
HGPIIRSPEGGLVSLSEMPERDPKEALSKRQASLNYHINKHTYRLIRCPNLAQETRGNFKTYARMEFQKYISVNKKDFNAIEYLLRKGHRQLEIYSSPGIRNIR